MVISSVFACIITLKKAKLGILLSRIICYFFRYWRNLYDFLASSELFLPHRANNYKISSPYFLKCVAHPRVWILAKILWKHRQCLGGILILNSVKILDAALPRMTGALNLVWLGDLNGRTPCSCSFCWVTGLLELMVFIYLFLTDFCVPPITPTTTASSFVY